MTNVQNIGIAVVGYAGGFLIGSCLLRWILRFVDPSLRKGGDSSGTGSPAISAWPNFREVGTWIGLCEHFLIVTFVLANEYTAIALVFAAKGLVRAERMREQASYYLLGTLLNTCFALLTGLTIKAVLQYGR